MKKIALATAALLVAAGSAFAENPNGPQNDISKQPVAVDHSYTASIAASQAGHHPADEYNSQLNTGR